MPEKKQLHLFASVAVIACLVGCQSSDSLNIEYGKVIGRRGSTSLNGVSVLADMYQERGLRVKSRNRISPRIYDYNTLVWFPDRNSCPSEEAIEALDLWLSEGYMRTLVFVGRDYDCQTDYLTRVLADAPTDQKEEILRQLAEARLLQDSRRSLVDFWTGETRAKCEWFEQVTLPHEKASQLSGPMASSLVSNPQLGSSGPQLEMGTLLAPRTGKDKGDWQSQSLLDADGHEFAFCLSLPVNRYDESNENKILVVSNGSFLLNFALVDPVNRQLAGKLIDESAGFGDVLFLESGPGEIKVSDSDTINQNSWAWIAEAPLRYIVPHFLMWGILFCFVFFPIFGRPRKRETDTTSNFRNHVNAIGKLFGRSKLPDQAILRIHKYQQSINSDSNRNKNET